MKFAEKLDRLIAASGKTQGRIAEEAKLARTAVSDMTAQARRPYMDQAFRLACALGVSLDYLADDSLDDPPADEFTEDERAVIDLLRALRLSKSEALRRVAASTADAQAMTDDEIGVLARYRRLKTERNVTEKDMALAFWGLERKPMLAEPIYHEMPDEKPIKGRRPSRQTRGRVAGATIGADGANEQAKQPARPGPIRTVATRDEDEVEKRVKLLPRPKKGPKR